MCWIRIWPVPVRNPMRTGWNRTCKWPPSFAHIQENEHIYAQFKACLALKLFTGWRLVPLVIGLHPNDWCKTCAPSRCTCISTWAIARIRCLSWLGLSSSHIERLYNSMAGYSNRHQVVCRYVRDKRRILFAKGSSLFKTLDLLQMYDFDPLMFHA